ncbi:MAG: phytanoyl-CoA dioxygenase family protein [Actinomycetales bacterium]|jgi:ectoine hydroxylase-related dioxygenase (phytanoyl-CoA dioxygenase family)|nr:phytanoyl-CoA dioxygenase family protein [Actinomycetales bacterium]
MTVTENAWMNATDVELADFERVVTQETDLSEFPNAIRVDKGVLIYDCAQLNFADPDNRREIEAELSRALDRGPGVYVLRGAYGDTNVIDQASQIFMDILASERDAGGPVGDHFGKASVNGRIWNAQQKLALRAPEIFARYCTNQAIATACHSWLGPNYQITAQVNLVFPGGQAQEPHNDYHLGFQSNESLQQFPAHVHKFSPFLTLQGAIAHCDMPVESGTTMLLPHSQKYPQSYLAWRHQEIKDFFAQHLIQLPLSKGDALFFNPALMHGAGTNHSSDIERMANLLQVSSAFGRAMENLDRKKMCEAVYPYLLEMQQSGTLSKEEVENSVAACAEGYPFPTNLDNDQPIGGLAPESQAHIMRASLAQGLSTGEFIQLLNDQVIRTSS